MPHRKNAVINIYWICRGIIYICDVKFGLQSSIYLHCRLCIAIISPTNGTTTKLGEDVLQDSKDAVGVSVDAYTNMTWRHWSHLTVMWGTHVTRPTTLTQSKDVYFITGEHIRFIHHYDRCSYRIHTSITTANVTRDDRDDERRTTPSVMIL